MPESGTVSSGPRSPPVRGRRNLDKQRLCPYTDRDSLPGRALEPLLLNLRAAPLPVIFAAPAPERVPLQGGGDLTAIEAQQRPQDAPELLEGIGAGPNLGRSTGQPGGPQRRR